MHIPPKRRRRIIQIHYLQQHGHSQRQIAEQLNLSPATVRADLQLAETHWSSIAAAAADDLLLESLQLLQIRLSLAITQDDVADNAERLTPVEFLRARDARETRFNALAREIRRTAHDIHRRAEQRPDQPGLYAQEPQGLAETTPKLSKTAHPQETISSPEQENVSAVAALEKLLLETPQPPPLDADEALIYEAVKHFPQLEGQSDEQIFTFLDQLTDPDSPNPDLPPPIQAVAAG